MHKYMFALAISAAAGGAQAKPLDLSNGVDALAAFRKIQCSRVDGQNTLYHWSGNVFARVPGEPDKMLFKVEGMNVRACTTVNDEKRGAGVRMVSREIMLYTDAKTGEVLRTWANPWTGKTNDVIHVANDPVNMRGASFPITADGKPYDLGARLSGGHYFQNIEVPLFYTNPLAGDYQSAAGNQYHATEMFNFIIDEKDLVDAKKPTADSAVISWVRIAPWLPFMDMGSKVGVMYVNATGHKLKTFDELPAVLKTEIRANYPAYTTAPPLDDKRPNETSWTYYKKLMEAKRAKAAEAK
jgi:Protein of unknown function (DUF1838)